MMGGWLIWVILGGLFLFLMFRGGGCCGGHGGHGGNARGSHGGGHDRSAPESKVNPGEAVSAS